VQTPSRAVVRDASAADLPRLLALEQLFPGDRLSLRQFRHHLASSSARLRVAVVADALAGYALTLLRKGSNAARLYSIVVDPARRGLGLGETLLADALQQARLAGKTELRLEVREDNASAIALYQRMGFTPFGRREGYYEDGCAALRFVRQLR
jgi:ribosomal-protein-alanine N-acetyltransferase